MNNRAQTEAFTGINWFPVAHDPTKRLAPKEDDDQSKVDSSLDAAIYILGCPEIGYTGTPQNCKIEGKTMTNGFEMMWGMRYPTFGEPMNKPTFGAQCQHAHFIVTVTYDLFRRPLSWESSVPRLWSCGTQVEDLRPRRANCSLRRPTKSLGGGVKPCVKHCLHWKLGGN